MEPPVSERKPLTNPNFTCLTLTAQKKFLKPLNQARESDILAFISVWMATLKQKPKYYLSDANFFSKFTPGVPLPEERLL